MDPRWMTLSIRLHHCQGGSLTLHFVIPTGAEGPAVSLSGTAKVPWADRLRVPFFHQRKLQVPPLRCAPVGMTKWKVAAHLGSGGDGWTEPAQLAP